MRRLRGIFRWIAGRGLQEPSEDWDELVEAERRLAVLQARLELMKRR